MFPDNLPKCKQAFQNWKDLGDGRTMKPGHRDKIWQIQNNNIDSINALAKAEYIRLNGNADLFLPIPHVDIELFQHLAVYIWMQAGGENTFDESQCVASLCSKGLKDEALTLAKSKGLVGLMYFKVPKELINNTTAILVFQESIIEYLYQLYFVKDSENATKIANKISNGEIYKNT
jgi:hypothetical protein